MRTVDESILLIDTIVGRCVRDPDFARRVMDDPPAALAEYGLNAGEFEDFLALRSQMGDSAVEVWNGLRELTFLRALAKPT